jgi:Leu/Phe-tRNA-protein transferase
LLDCQIENPHLLSLGAEPMSRREYCATLAAAQDIVNADWRPSARADWPA